MSEIDDIIHSYGCEVLVSSKIIRQYQDAAIDELSKLRGKKRDLRSAVKRMIVDMRDASDHGDLGAKKWLRKFEEIIDCL